MKEKTQRKLSLPFSILTITTQLVSISMLLSLDIPSEKMTSFIPLPNTNIESIIKKALNLLKMHF